MLAGQQLGPFTVAEEIGSGAMGTVYRARYTKSGQAVALKVISGGHDTNATALARFEREAVILKKLNHPNIVRLYATGRYRGTPFYVMEFVDGESLEAMLQRRGRFTWEEVVALGGQVCAALQHAHQQGIVHRDLKPANVMMTPAGVVKLTDFGIAKGLEVTQLTATNCTVGTASYMSPEQCRGERHLSHKSDLYSLGVVFYELLTGRRPFLADNILDMFQAHTGGKFERPSRLVMDIPIWLDTLVCQLLEKEPEKRPFDASLVAKALEDIQEKVAAQRSAGVDVATARRVDVPRHQRPRDESDREAGRILRAAASKRKLKRRTRPFYERGWFLAAGISALLAGVGLTVWQVIKPATADQLFLRAQSLMASTNAEDWDKAREGPIADFLKRHPEDPRKAEVQAWADKVDLAWREKQLHNKMRLEISPEGEVEPVAFAAVKLEDNGDLEDALERWEGLVKHKGSPDPDRHRWGLLAEKRVQTIRDAQARETQCEEQARKARRGESEHPPGSDVERWAATAVRSELFEDYSLALQNWRRVKGLTQKDTAQRVWFLLAAQKVRTLTPRAAPAAKDEKRARLDLVERKLDEAVALKANKPGEAKALCRDVIALYGKADDPELAQLVERARTLLR